MSSIVIAGDTSGSVTLQAPAVSGSTILTLPATSGTVQTSGAGFTTNGVAYASSTSALATGSGLIFNGTNLGLGVTPSAWGTTSGQKALQIGTSGFALSSSGAGAGDGSLNWNGYYNGTNWIYSYSGGGSSRYRQNENGHAWFYAPSGTAGNAISFTQAMTLDASGNLLVGTTTSAGKLTVQQSAVAQTVYLNNSNASPFGMQIQYTGAAPNITDNEFIYCADTANNRFIVYSSGNVANRNNVYGAISDVKLKENIVDASPKLSDLMQVKVRNYNLIGETTKQIGVVAQELETVFPSMVEESPDKDNERNNLGTTTKQVKYSVFVPMLIKAIQEQQAIIESLKARLDAANL